MTLPFFKSLQKLDFKNLFDPAVGSELGVEKKIFENSSYSAEDVKEWDGETPVYNSVEKGVDLSDMSQWTYGPNFSEKVANENVEKLIEPEILRKRAPLLTEEEFNKYMAMFTIENSNVVFENFRYFAAIVLALNNIIPNFTVYEIPEPKHMWYAIKEIKKLRPTMEFSEEVKQFVKIASNEQGYYIYPPELDLENVYYEKALKILNNAVFPLSDDTTEEIQAAKLLEIQLYLSRMSENGR